MGRSSGSECLARETGQIGDPRKAEEKLCWKASVLTPQLAKIMVENDMKQVEVGGKIWIDAAVNGKGEPLEGFKTWA